MRVELTARGRALLDRARDALGMADARDREVVVAAVERYADAGAPDPPNVEVEPDGSHTSRVLVPGSVREDVFSIRQAHGGPGQVSGGEAVEMALSWVVGTGGGGFGGEPFLPAPDPARLLERATGGAVRDPVITLLLAALPGVSPGETTNTNDTNT